MRSRSEMALEWLVSLVNGIQPESDSGRGFSVAEAKGPSKGHREQRRTVRIEPSSLTGAGEMRAAGPAARPIDVYLNLRLVVFYPAAGDDVIEVARRASDAARLLVDLYANSVLTDEGQSVHVSSLPRGEVVFGSRIPNRPASAQPVPTLEVDLRLRFTEEANT